MPAWTARAGAAVRRDIDGSRGRYYHPADMGAIHSWRSPRPWLAVAITAALLGLVLLAAWQVARSRMGRDQLGPPEAARDWPVLWRPPQRWGELPEEWLGQTVVAGRLDRDGRAALLLLGNLPKFVPPKAVTSQMLKPVLDRRFRRYRLVREAREPASLGPLAASESLWTVRAAQDLTFVLARQAVDPSGRAVAVALASPYMPREKDLRLLNALADSLELTDLAFQQSGQATGGALRVDLPEGARLVQMQGRTWVACPRHASQPWNVELRSVSLGRDQTLDDLLREHLRRTSSGRVGVQWGQRESAAGREIIWAVLVQRRQGDVVEVVAGVALGRSRAVTIEAVGELGGVDELVAMCRRIAATVTVAGNPL